MKNLIEDKPTRMETCLEGEGGELKKEWNYTSKKRVDGIE